MTENGLAVVAELVPPGANHVNDPVPPVAENLATPPTETSACSAEHANAAGEGVGVGVEEPQYVPGPPKENAIRLPLPKSPALAGLDDDRSTCQLQFGTGILKERGAAPTCTTRVSFAKFTCDDVPPEIGTNIFHDVSHTSQFCV